MIKKYQKLLLALFIPFAFLMIISGIFLSNRYKINNFAQNMTSQHSINTINQSIFMYSHRTLKYIHLYSEDNALLNVAVTVSQGENKNIFTNIAEYQYKDGSFRLPVNFKISSTNDLIIELKGENLDKILLSDNTLLGKLTSMPNQNLKVSMTFWNDINKEQYTLLYASVIILLMLFFIMVIILSENLYFTAFSIIYTYLVIQYITILPAAETLSNFAYYAYHESIFTALKTADAGYLPLIPRVISLLLIKIFKVQELYVVWTYIFSFFFGAMSISFFTLNIFNKIIPHHIIRLLIVFLLASLVPSDVIPIYNSPYWGMSFLVLTPLLNKNTIPSWLYIILLLIIPSLFLSKLLFLTIAPIYGLLFLYYAHQWYFKKNYQQKELIFYTVALLGAIGQVIYYLFLSTGQVFVKNTTFFTLSYVLPNLARYVLSPLKMHITDLNSLYMGLVLTGIILIFMQQVKHKNEITKKLWYPFILTLGLYIVFIAVLSSIRGWNQMYLTDLRHSIIPIILTGLIYSIFLYKNINMDWLWENIYFRCLSLFFICIITITPLMQIRYNSYGFSYGKYTGIINQGSPYVIPLSVNYISCASLRHNVNQVGEWGKPTELSTNFEQINAIYVTGKKLTEQLIIKGFDKNGSNILNLQEFIPSYKTVAYFKFGTNTNYITEFKIFNQNGIDRTKELKFSVFTNINI